MQTVRTSSRVDTVGTTVVAWALFLGGVDLFNTGRAWVHTRVLIEARSPYLLYPILFDRAALFGHTAPYWLQHLRTPALDVFFTALHATHFVAFLLLTAWLWHTSRKAGLWAMRALGVVFGVGLACYYLVPTVPPWLASEHGAVSPLAHVAMDYYARWFRVETVQILDTNPVAAMPSLHVAMPAACVGVIGACCSRVTRGVVSTYLLAQCVGVMYLGEHYLLDVLAGLLLAWLAVRLTRPYESVTVF